jgi:hypothetical protein
VLLRNARRIVKDGTMNSFILFDREPQEEVKGIRQAEEAGEDETNREWKLN